MSAAALARLSRGAIELRVEDRLQSLAAPIRNMSAAMVGMLAGSIVVHGLLLATAVVAARQAPPAAPKEIAVEVVQEAPKPPPPVPQAKPQPQQRPMLPPTLLKAAPPPQRAARSVPPKPAAPKPPAPTPAAQEAKTLQDEVNRLRAEQAALKAARGEQRAGFDRALALPSIGGDGDAVTYDQLVFSQLAKAKGEQADLGQAGVTCVRFEMDARGALVSVAIVTPSGNPKLDAKALDIVRRAAPFPPPPTDSDRIVFANVNFTPPTTTR